MIKNNFKCKMTIIEIKKEKEKKRKMKKKGKRKMIKIILNAK